MEKHGEYETDLIQTSAGDLSITFLGHASLLITFKGQIYPYRSIWRGGRLYHPPPGGYYRLHA
jgi:hypothetical protein